MQFDSISAALVMGGHGGYVWAVAVVTLWVVVYLLLAPVLTGLVLAFLLQGIVVRLERWRVPSGPAVYLTFVLFLGALIALMLSFDALVGEMAALKEQLAGKTIREWVELVGSSFAIDAELEAL